MYTTSSMTDTRFVDMRAHLWCSCPSLAVRLWWDVKSYHCCVPIVCLQINSAKTWIWSTTTAVRPPSVWPGGLFRAGSRGHYLCTTWQARKELHRPPPQQGALWTKLLKSGPPAWEAEKDPGPVNPLSPAAFISSGGTSITCPLPPDWLLRLIMLLHTHSLWYPAGVCLK